MFYEPRWETRWESSKYVWPLLPGINIWSKWILLILQLLKNVKIVLTFNVYLFEQINIFCVLAKFGPAEFFAQNAFQSYKILHMNKFEALCQ